MALVVSSGADFGADRLWLPEEVWHFLLKTMVGGCYDDPRLQRNVEEAPEKPAFRAYGVLSRVCSLFNRVLRSYSFYAWMMRNCGYRLMPAGHHAWSSSVSANKLGDPGGLVNRITWVSNDSCHYYTREAGGPALVAQSYTDQTARFSLCFTAPRGRGGMFSPVCDTVTINEKGALLGVYKKKKKGTARWKPVPSAPQAASARRYVLAATKRTVAQIQEWRAGMARDFFPELGHSLTNWLRRGLD